MARPTKQGIDYFPIDCQFDEKLELLIVDKGGIALSVIVTLWQLIYQNNGYYVKNGHDLALLIKRRIMVDSDIIEDIISAAVDRDIFNKKLYKKHKILTSPGIQKRFFTASRLKKSVSIVKNYLLIDVSNVDNLVYVVENATYVKGEVKEEEKEKENIYAAFEIFWESYPKRNGRKVGKVEAREKFKKINFKNGEFEQLLSAVKNYSSQEFPKDAQRFLAKDYWKDWIDGAIGKKVNWDSFNFGGKK